MRRELHAGQPSLGHTRIPCLMLHSLHVIAIESWGLALQLTGTETHVASEATSSPYAAEHRSGVASCQCQSKLPSQSRQLAYDSGRSTWEKCCVPSQFANQPEVQTWRTVVCIIAVPMPSIGDFLRLLEVLSGFVHAALRHRGGCRPGRCFGQPHGAPGGEPPLREESPRRRGAWSYARPFVKIRNF